MENSMAPRGPASLRRRILLQPPPYTPLAVEWTLLSLTKTLVSETKQNKNIQKSKDKTKNNYILIFSFLYLSLTGAFLQMAVFDTHFNTSNSESFATYIKAIATGRIVVMNIKDEAFLHLTENAYLACESVGSALIRQLK